MQPLSNLGIYNHGVNKRKGDLFCDLKRTNIKWNLRFRIFTSRSTTFFLRQELLSFCKKSWIRLNLIKGLVQSHDCFALQRNYEKLCNQECLADLMTANDVITSSLSIRQDCRWRSSVIDLGLCPGSLNRFAKDT